MIGYRLISALHANAPQKFLQLWASSPQMVSFTNVVALGKERRQLYEKLKELEQQDNEQLRVFQSSMLKGLVAHCNKNIPYYRELFAREGISPGSIRSLEDLKKIPITTKEDVQSNFHKFFDRSKRFRVKFYRETSGTSGKPMRFYLDQRCIAANWATEQYFKELFGCTIGKDVMMHVPLANRFVYFLSRAPLRFGNYTPLTRQLIFSGDNLDEKTFNTFVDSIRKHPVNHIEAYPSILFAFSKYLEKKRITLHLKTATCSSEMLYDTQRVYIEKQLGCEVFNKYASAESTLRGYECHCHDGIHLAPYGIAQVGGKASKDTGNLVMTNLMNHVFPLLRYCANDVVDLSQKKCRCGRSFIRLMNVHGRTNDCIVLPDGSSIHSAPLFRMSVDIRGINDLFVIQEKNYELIIYIVKEKHIDRLKIAKQVNDRIQRLSGNTLKCSIVFTTAIPRRNSKFKVVESSVYNQSST